MHPRIVGIDEVGRGCWAGPVVAGAVLLSESIRGLKDSKLLTRKQRERLAEEIMQYADYGLGWVWPEEIDRIGLTAAVAKAMRLAIEQITQEYDEIVIDGNQNFLPHIPKAITMIKADAIIPAVSAASILAKVARDNYMAEQADKFPNYGFDKHVGYGTAMHIEMLKLHGICELHRLSYKPIRALI